MSKDSHRWQKQNWLLSWLVPVCIAPVIAAILTPPDLVTLIIVIAVVVSFLISKWEYQMMKAAQFLGS